MSNLTKADILNIIADLERAIESSEDAMKDKDDKSHMQGRIHAYKYAVSRVKAMAQWKDMKLI